MNWRDVLPADDERGEAADIIQELLDGRIGAQARSHATDLVARLRVALSSPETTPACERGTCWFCKDEFVIDALIAGYDTFEEQRLACLACNERMSGNWRPA